MQEVVIVAYTRTKVGKFGGSLAEFSAVDLGSAVIKNLLAKTALDASLVDEVIMGQVLSAGAGQNPARQAALKAGLSNCTPAFTINKVCGSGLKAVQLASQAIKCQDAQIIIAGGQENMSQSMHLLPNSRSGKRMGNWQLTDSMIKDGLWCAINDYHMGITAENVAQKYAISRQQQDEFALKSHQRASAAAAQNQFAGEITTQLENETSAASIDEGVRENASLANLAQLKPVFKQDGTVTAGNASSLNDGAAAVMLMSKQRAQQLKLPIIASIKAYAAAGIDPAIMGAAPIYAIQNCLKKANWQIEDLDLIEANEAFAAQACAVNQELGLDSAKVNVNGGAIAIGHPIGASGARILVSLINQMQQQQQQKGMAALCIGGGMSVAVAVERGND